MKKNATKKLIKQSTYLLTFIFGILSLTLNAQTKLSGTVIGTPGSWNNDPDKTIEAVFDGDVNTFLDAPTENANDAWVGLDLGSVKQITEVRYYPRSKKPDRMNGGIFQASNTADFSSGVVDLHTITSNPSVAWNEQTISNSNGYQYVRYLAPFDSYGNVAELEFYGMDGLACSFTVSQTAHEFDASAGNTVIEVTTDQSFTASADQAWITTNIDGSSLTISVDENTILSLRTGTVTIEGCQTQTVDISQKSPDADTKDNLTGTIIGTDGSYGNNPDNTKEAAMDGNISTYFDAPSGSNGWVGLDLGSEYVINKVRYYPKSNKGDRMNGGRFQASNNPDFTSGVVDLFTITSNVPNAWTENAISSNTGYRYVRYISPDGGYCNVAEVEFYGEIKTGCTVSLSKTLHTFPSDGGTTTMDVTSSEAFIVTSNDDWITTSTNGNTITVSVTENTSIDPRSGELTITGCETRFMLIEQSGNTPNPGWHNTGMGLGGITYYTSYPIFNDVIKHVRWIDVASWNERGYPASANAGQTITARAGVGDGDLWPEGNYTLTWTGDGEVRLNGTNAELVSENLTSDTKERVYKWTPESYGIEVAISSFPVDNIHLYLPGQKDNPSMWNPAYLEYIKPFSGKHLRFMDLNGTNGSQQENWSDRMPKNWSSYSNNNNDNCTPWETKGKVSYEAMIELCNEIGADIWICIPHKATEDYVTKLAHLIKTGVDQATGVQTTDPLKSNLKVWLEYSNEVWNPGFSQTNWLNNNISGSSLDDKYANHAVGLYDIFETEFNASDRVIRVLGTQFGYSGGFRTKNRLEAVSRDKYDALALTTYFEADFRQFMYDNWPITIDDAIDYLDETVGAGIFKDSEPNSEAVNLYWTYYYARQHNVPVIAYEGNDHINPVGKIDTDNDGKKDIELNAAIEEATDFIHSVMRDNRIEGIYKKWLTRHTQTGLVTNTPFVLLDGWSMWGQWGHVEYLGQSVEEAPKYKALLDFYELPYPEEIAGDLLAPSTPENLNILDIKSDSVVICWNSAEDNVGIFKYHVLIDGAFSKSVFDTIVIISGLSPETTYEISVVAYDLAGLSSDASMPISVTTLKAPEPDPTGLREQANSDAMIYPNPATERITAYVPGAPQLSVNIFDTTGKIVYSRRAMGETLNIKVANLEKGLYVISVNGNNRKLIIK